MGVNVNPVGETGEVNSWMEGIERVLNIAIHNNVAPQLGSLSWYIEPEEMMRFHLFSLDKGTEMYDIGYRAAQRALETLPKQLTH